MPKICSIDGCSNFVFAKLLCKWHQGHRTDKKPKPLKKISEKRTAYKQSGKTEIDIFNEIWEERPHISELSGKPLPYGKDNPSMWVRQFLHVLNKGRFDSLRLDKRNILLGTPEEHDHQDQYEPFKQRKIELLREVYLSNNPDQI